MSGTVNLKAVADVNKAIYETQRLERSLGTLGKTGETTGSKLGHALGVGLKVAAVAGAVGLAAVAYGAKKALDAAGDFQQQLNVLQATSGATARQLKALSAEAIKLGADAKLPATSAKDAADAMTELSKAGLSVKDTMAAARPVLQLSAAAQISNADAAIYTATALNAFNLAGTSAGKVADLLAAAANASAGDVPQMGEALQFAGSAAHGAGQEIQEVVAAIAEMSNAGLSGSVAGSSLAQALRSLQAPTAKAKDEMQKLGINVYNSQGKMKDMGEIVRIFSAQMGGLTQQQKNQALATIFGSRAVQAARIVFTGGTQAFNKMRDAVTKVGAAQKLAEAQTKGFKGALQAFQSAVETLAIVVGLKLLPVATKVAHALGNVVNDISKVAAAPSLTVGIKLLVNMGGHVYESIKAALLGETKQVGGQLGAGGRGGPQGHNRAVTVQTTGIIQQLQRSIEGVDWTAIGRTVGTALGSAIKFTAATASAIITSLTDAIVANRGQIASAALVIALSIVQTATDPGFWKDNWQLIATVAISAIPATKFAKIGELVGIPLLRGIFAVLDRLPLRFQFIAQRLPDIADRVFTRLVRVTSRIVGRILAEFLRVPDGIATAFTRAVSTIAGALTGLVGTVIRVVVGILKKIDSIGKEADSIGRSILRVAAKFTVILGVVNLIGSAIDYAVSAVGSLVSAIGKIHFPHIPGSGLLGSVASVVGATGGIVNRPTYALIGEKGPEAVIPLDRSRGNRPLPRGGISGGDVHITLNMQHTDPMLALSYLGIKLDRAIGIPS